MDYAKKNEADGIIFELRIDLGRCKTIQPGDAKHLYNSWQHDFDSAWAPQGANRSGLEENCVKDPRRITILRAIAGHTGKLRAMGMVIENGNLMAMADMEHLSTQRRSEATVECRGRRIDGDLYRLLCDFKLEGEADLFALHGVTSVGLLQELDSQDVKCLDLPLMQRKMLRRLLAHVTPPGSPQSTDAACVGVSSGSPYSPQTVSRNAFFGSAASTDTDVDTFIEQIHCWRTNPNSVQRIIAEMNRHRRHIGLQMAACRVLRDLAASADSKYITAITQEGGLDCLLETMRQHPQHTALQQDACSVLGHCRALGRGNNLKVLEQKDAVKVIVQAMREHADCPDVQVQGCWALSSVGRPSTTLAAQIKDAGGVEAIKSTIAAGAPSWCRIMGERLLGYLEPAPSDERARVFLAEIVAMRKERGIGCLRRILAGMRNHEDSADVMEVACSAVCEWVTRDDANKRQKAFMHGSAKVGEEIISAVGRAMRTHRASVSVCLSACIVLGNLAFFLNKITEEGCIECVVSAMQVHTKDLHVQEQGCHALLCIVQDARLLSDDTGTLLSLMFDAGAVHAVAVAKADSGATDKCRREAQRLLKMLGAV